MQRQKKNGNKQQKEIGVAIGRTIHYNSGSRRPVEADLPVDVLCIR